MVEFTQNILYDNWHRNKSKPNKCDGYDLREINIVVNDTSISVNEKTAQRTLIF